MRIVLALRDNLFARALLTGKAGRSTIGCDRTFRNTRTVGTHFVRAALTGVLADARRGDARARRTGEPACTVRSGLTQTRTKTTAAYRTEALDAGFA